MRSLLSFQLLLLPVFNAHSFLFPLTLSRTDLRNLGRRSIEKQRSSLDLRPIGKVEGHGEDLHAFASLTTHSPTPPIGNDDFSDISMVQESDLSELSRHVLSVFGANFVRWTMGGGTGLWDSTTGRQQSSLTSTNSMTTAYTEVLLGFQYRLGKRLARMNLLSPLTLSAPTGTNPIPSEVEQGSLVLVISRNRSSHGPSGSVSANSTEIVASVELALEPMEFLFPRSQESTTKPDGTIYVPYIRNLCVNEDMQRRKLGTTLMECAEHITNTIWGFNEVSLHVFDDNVVANAFYQGMGYQIASNEGGILYYMKPLPLKEETRA
eukprot:Nitzschia sp. Nitz4//scaffold70_size99833//59733//60771//NITZ4_004600-RA/size99833-exonerate_est2genome-gene-0.63-mRNA-1//1//CDS//3329557150//3641//frame0